MLLLSNFKYKNVIISENENYLLQVLLHLYLQAYLNAITSIPMLANSLIVKKFLDERNYSTNFLGEFFSL